MRPPACTQCRWGTGTTTEKSKDSIAKKEIETKLKQLQDARAQQDARWLAPLEPEKKPSEQRR